MTPTPELIEQAKRQLADRLVRAKWAESAAFVGDRFAWKPSRDGIKYINMIASRLVDLGYRPETLTSADTIAIAEFFHGLIANIPPDKLPPIPKQ